MKLIVLQFFLMCVVSSFGQINFYKQFSNNGYDYGEGIVQTEDTSYFITGTSSSFTEGPSQAFLLKVDSLGNFLWSRHFGGAESDGGKRVMYIEDEGVLIAGFTNSFGNGAYDFYLTKVDLAGNQLWEEAYGTSSWDRVYDAALTKDSGVIMVGETLNTEDGESDILIVRTDKNGAEVWSQQLGGAEKDVATCIQSFDDSTFIIGGTTYVEDSLKNKGLLLRLEDNGDLWWMDTVGVNGDYQINSVSVAYSTINAVGRLIKMGGDTANFQQKYNLQGDFQYEFFDNNVGVDYMQAIVPFGNTNKFMVVSTYDNAFSYGKFDLGFQKYFHELYFEQNIALVNYSDTELLGQLIPTIDNGAIGVGSILRTGDGGSNVFILKMYDGQPYFDSGLISDTESLVTVDEIVGVHWKGYPNPTNGIFNLTFQNAFKLENIDVYDQIGRKISVNIVQIDQNTTTLDLMNMNNGIYKMIITYEGINYYQNIVVNK